MMKRNVEIDQETLEDFVLWSLNENKNDLTPKKLSKMNPHIMMKLVTGDISIENILEKRKAYLTYLETRIENIEFDEGIDHLMTGMKFANQEKLDEFRQQLEDCFTQKLHDYLYDAFHEVVSKWSDSSHIHMEDSLFFRKSKAEFDELCQDLLKDLVSSSISAEEKEIVIIDKYYLHPTARNELHKTGDFYAQDQLQSVLLLLKEMYSCSRCRQLYIEDEGVGRKFIRYY